MILKLLKKGIQNNMNELMKKYIKLTIENRKNNEIHQQLLQERHEKISFIKDNESVFCQELKNELIYKIVEFYDKEFKEILQKIEITKREINILWEIASDEERYIIEEYFSNITFTMYNRMQEYIN